MGKRDLLRSEKRQYLPGQNPSIRTRSVGVARLCRYSLFRPLLCLDPLGNYSPPFFEKLIVLLHLAIEFVVNAQGARTKVCDQHGRSEHPLPPLLITSRSLLRLAAG